MTANSRALVVETVIERTPDEIWGDVRDIASHVGRMRDAVAIRFLNETREGLGTRFECCKSAVTNNASKPTPTAIDR